jgi:hypothetical protein
MMPVPISPDRLKDKLFRIKKLQYNIYEIESTSVVGQLRLVVVPINVLEIPEDMIPPQLRTGSPTYGLNTQAIVGFTNLGRKLSPQMVNLSPTQIQTARKIDLTNAIQDNPFEPWNELVVQGDPPVRIKFRTILTKVEWLMDYSNPLGDPFLWAQHNTTHSVSVSSVGDAGLQ